MDTAIVIFTRDLRVHDNPALTAACANARQVVPLFIVDPGIHAPPNRMKFLAQSLDCLREQLRARGAELVIRRGDPAGVTAKLAREVNAQAVYIASDVSRYAARRRAALTAVCSAQRLGLVFTPGLTVVPPGELTPAAGSHYRVFTPYWHAWRAARWRQPCPAPESITMPPLAEPGAVPAVTVRGLSPGLAPGGEQESLRRVRSWQADGLAQYGMTRDDLAAGQTSRLSAYLRFGCLSPLQLAVEVRDLPGGAEFLRQLAWRDFFYQVTAAFPEIATRDYRPGPGWRADRDALDAWCAGRTGIPIVDAGMRQLTAEGYMHNRARMITASFLTRNLRIDWRDGYRHFSSLLADGDVACNAGNWQWVAGTGNNTRPNRVMNPLRQARRFDKTGDYVRRYVPELGGLDARLIHTPWLSGTAGYPPPILELS